MNAYCETEIKLYVPDLAAARARLEQANARLAAARVYERNVRYEDAGRTLTPAGIVVRLRQDTRVRLTYKGPANSSLAAAGIASRFEAEVEVSDFDAMHTILGKLGYTPYMIYEKYRTTYHLDDVEIALDELPYGHFIEIEGEAEAIERAAARLALADAPRFSASYAELFERVKQCLHLTFTDLTFANFAGIYVPASAFQP